MATRHGRTEGPRWAPRVTLRSPARRLGVLQALGFVAAATATAVLFAAVLITLTDPDVFPDLGVALWWSVTTITTVGYGDVVPLSGAGRTVGAMLMFGGVSGVAFVTAIAASSIVVSEVEEGEREIEDFEHRVEHRLDLLATRLTRIEHLLRTVEPAGRSHAEWKERT